MNCIIEDIIEEKLHCFLYDLMNYLHHCMTVVNGIIKQNKLLVYRTSSKKYFRKSEYLMPYF